MNYFIAQLVSGAILLTCSIVFSCGALNCGCFASHSNESYRNYSQAGIDFTLRDSYEDPDAFTKVQDPSQRTEIAELEVDVLEAFSLEDERKM